MPWSSTPVVSTAGTGTTSAIDTTGCTFLVATVVNDSSGTGSGEFSDSRGNSWSPTNTYNHSSGAAFTTIFYCVNPTVGTGHTFAAQNSKSAIVVSGWTGGAASPLDQQAGGGQTTTNNTQIGNIVALTPTQNNELVIYGFGLLYSVASSTFLHATSGAAIAIAGRVSSVLATNYGVFQGYRVQTTAAALNPIGEWTTQNGGADVAATFFSAPPPPPQTAIVNQPQVAQLPEIPGTVGFLQFFSIEPGPVVQGPVYPPTSPPNSFPLPLVERTTPAVPGSLGFLQESFEPVLFKQGPIAPPTSPPNSFPIPLVELGPGLPGSVQFLMRQGELPASVQGAPNPPAPSPAQVFDPLANDFQMFIPGTLPFLRVFYEPERLSIQSGNPGLNVPTMPLLNEGPQIPGSLWFLVQQTSDSNRSQPGPGPPPPPPVPPPPTPVYALTLLNRLPLLPGVDARLVRIGDQVSALWNSLARQSILKQIGPEDYTLAIRELDYFAAVSGHWANSPPATVGAALDRIAALLAALSGGPIP